MSRIGRMPISVPAGVEITNNNNVITVKGAKGELELREAKRALDILGVEIESVQRLNHEGLGERINLIFRKISRTPLKYPRNYGKIKKTPLSGRKNG